MNEQVYFFKIVTLIYLLNYHLNIQLIELHVHGCENMTCNEPNLGGECALSNPDSWPIITILEILTKNKTKTKGTYNLTII